MEGFQVSRFEGVGFSDDLGAGWHDVSRLSGIVTDAVTLQGFHKLCVAIAARWCFQVSGLHQHCGKLSSNESSSLRVSVNSCSGPCKRGLERSSIMVEALGIESHPWVRSEKTMGFYPQVPTLEPSSSHLALA